MQCVCISLKDIGPRKGEFEERCQNLHNGFEQVAKMKIDVETRNTCNPSSDETKKRNALFIEIVNPVGGAQFLVTTNLSNPIKKERGE